MNIQLENERAPQSQYFQGLSAKRHVMRKMSDRKSWHHMLHMKVRLVSPHVLSLALLLYYSLISRLISSRHTDLERSRNHVSVLPAYSMITVREY